MSAQVWLNQPTLHHLSNPLLRCQRQAAKGRQALNRQLVGVSGQQRRAGAVLRPASRC